jgi:hypothetical protein
VLLKQHRPTITVPTWVTATLAAAKRAPDITSIETFLGEGGPVLMIGDIDGVHFAVRRDQRWRISTITYFGGKASRPGYFGSVDLTRATGTPSIGVVISSYIKESCVRAEIIELVVLHVDGDELADHGSAVIGEGAWFAIGDKFGLFDPRDPNHYRIQLRPTVEPDGRIRLAVDSKHTPKSLRKRDAICGVETGFADIDKLLKLVGKHELAKLLESQKRKNEWDEDNPD